MKNLSGMQKFLIAVGVVIIITFGFIIFRQHNTVTFTKTQLESLTDTVKIYQNKQKQWVAERKSITGNYNTLRSQLLIAKAPKELQDLSKDKKVVGAFVSENKTTVDTSVKIDNSTQGGIVKAIQPANDGYTGKIDDQATNPFKYENFSRVIADTPWYTLNIDKKDSILKVGLEVKNKYVGSFKKQSDGGYLFTQTNLNPYDKATSVQSYLLTPDPVNKGKYFLWGGVTGVAALILLKVFVIK